MIIKSDNKPLQTLLFQLEKVLTDNGAWFHPNLSLICKENVVSVEIAGPCPRGEVTTRIPVELMVPTEHLNISIKDDKFVINPDKSKMSSAQFEISKLMFNIYNATDRVNSYNKKIPWISFQETPKLMNRLLETKMTDNSYKTQHEFLNKTENSMSIDEFICNDFMKNRIFAHKNPESDENILSILPIADFLYHDYRGGSYGFRESTEESTEAKNIFLEIENVQPFLEQSTCYASYGLYDAIDTFIRYGFISDNTPFLYSIPLKIKIQGTDGIAIDVLPHLYPPKVPKQLLNIKEFVPVINKHSDGKSLVLSKLIIALPPRGNALQRILRTSIRSMKREDMSEDLVQKQAILAEKFVLGQNITFYENFLEEIETDQETPQHLKDKMNFIASTQLSKLYKFVYTKDIITLKKREEKEIAEAV